MILDVLSTTTDGRASASDLTTAGAILGISDNAVRVTVSRMVHEGLLHKVERGVYQLGSQALALNREKQRWRHVLTERVSWDGSWLVIYVADLGRVDRRLLAKRNRALRLTGFRFLRRGLAVRPNNLQGGMAQTHERLVGLGLDPEALVMTSHDVAVSDDAIEDLWDCGAGRQQCLDMVDRLRSSDHALASMTLEEAAPVAFSLGRAAIDRIVKDPLLPRELSNDRPLKALVNAMKQYDIVGRHLWRQILRQGELV